MNWNRNQMLTAQQKAVAVNTIMGNPSIANQQGTSRVLYDTLPLDGRQEFRFFENVANRQFPFTNLNQNRLQVGETFVLERIYFSIVTQQDDLFDISTIEVAGLNSLYLSDFSIFYDTMQVVKPIPFASIFSDFAHSVNHADQEWFGFDNKLALPTDVQFRCEVDSPNYGGVIENTFLRCTWEGFGTILSPKSQF